MPEVFLDIPGEEYRALRSHLLSPSSRSEAAAFLFARPAAAATIAADATVFEYVDWYGVPPHGLVTCSEYHLELTDETRARVIKQAHDLDASLVEFHRHGGLFPAAFSLTDRAGFDEFVPHVWWRLKGKPYLAVVVTEADFDGLVWLVNAQTPQHLDGIVVDGTLLRSTGLSSLKGEGHELV